ncbi:PREDICTED: uncharacterized protein LOC107068848 [Polistes dominula]|uniref:Uncharacterized protein LOC107068848 n=1 Tax=Polistes dominula TaxID=743375 RepID=A0ABM1ILP1_POLDO|nr:PREDICTED: uncharacterized protein LOC107068848 [Polistes dominula]
MGNIKSRRSGKPKKKVSDDKVKSRHSELEDDDFFEDDVEMDWLRRSIRNQPQYFVLNNLMMCIQFFENYEKDIQRIRKTLVSSREVELNERLAPHKHVLLPDVLQEKIAKNVGFLSSRQTLRPTIEPLQPVRIYVVHDNVEVIEEDDPTYSPMNDSSTYSMVLKQSKHSGYVKLQLQEETPLLKKVIAEEQSIKNDDGFYSDGDSLYGQKYSRNGGVGLNRQSKNNLQSSKFGHSSSSPNIYEDSTMYGSSSSHDRGKNESDHYKVDSLIDERSYRAPEPPPRNNGYLNRGDNVRKNIKHHHKSKMYSQNSRASSTSSGYRSGNYVLDSDSDCSCTHTCNLSRSSDDFYGTADSSKNMDGDSDRNQIPNQCFKKVTYTSEGKIYDPIEERRYPMNNKQKRIRQFLRRYNYNVFYVSSLFFMKHFFRVFVHQLTDVFGFDRETVDDRRPEGSIIYYDKVIVSHMSRLTMIEPYEIIPSVWSQWPEGAKEWLDRPRSTWPTDDEIGMIKDLGCYIVPEGFTPKKGINPQQDLEWQLTFPAAERYLETCMTSAQIQVYLMALVLHKTFIRPVFDSMFGLTTSHIRNRMFWMIEENDRPSKWPDNRTGECLIKLLQSMYYCISKNEPTLSDYFIRDKNLFQRIPSEHLLHTQKQLKRILENPIMYVFHAMENVKYSQQFFPKINFESLLNILTANALTLINPALAGDIPKPLSKTNEDESSTRKASEPVYTETRPGGFWLNARNVSRTVDEQKIYANRPAVTNKTLINPRKATDSVIEISVQCADLDGIRLCALLDFFISHFIKMGERFHQYHAIEQKAIYLDHAERLSILLQEYPRCKKDAKAYREKIKVLRRREDHSKPENMPQVKPIKKTGEPIFTMKLKNRFTTESPEELSPKESETFNMEDHTYDSASVTKEMIQERPRTPTSPPRTTRGPAPMIPTPRVPSSIDKTSNPVRRTPTSINKMPTPVSRVSSPNNVPSPTRRVPSPINKVPSPIKRTPSSTDSEGSTFSKKVPSVTNEMINDEESLTIIRDKQIEVVPPRVVSLVENENESFLSETTYI